MVDKLNNKLAIVCIIFLLVLKSHNSSTFAANIINDWEITDKILATENVQKLLTSLDKALNFISQYYYEMNIDGALGVVLTEG